jgi:c-di-GMP-binding flagellar brake protein YcgR
MAAEETDRPAADDLGRFLIRSPAQIAAILGSIAEHRGIVTAYFNRGRQFVLTAIIEVDVPGQRVVIDRGSDDAANLRLLASDRVVLVTTQEKVKVQFSVGQVLEIDHEGRPAFSIALPSEVLKLQRREYFRVRTILTEPVRLRLPVGAAVDMLELQAHDVSIGGLAAFVALPADRSQVGTRFPGASVQIGTDTPFGVELELSNLNSVRLRNGADAIRAGFRFVDMPQSVQQKIQRYLLRIERERRSREAALVR